ncbi:MAG TPA: M48 family metalloprotease [Candidatus Binatia bacterium]|nr:M48 family metalloprotease [Candidatus Binatia bacterium]
MSILGIRQPRVLSLLLLAVVAAGCGGASVRRFEGKPVAVARDEKLLWQEAAQLEKAFADSKLLIRDDAVDGYLNAVTARVLDAYGVEDASIRVYVLRNPFVNAFVLPNGSVYLHTGLLALLENEAQLAGVLAHELEHYLGRHSLRRERSREQRETLLLLGGLFVTIMGGPGEAMLVSSAPAIESSVRGYSRDLEREADAAAYRAMIAAGYDGGQLARTFELLMSVEREAGVEEPFYYSNHPLTAERLKDSLAWQTAAPGDVSAPRRSERDDGYGSGVASVLLVNAAEDVRLRRFDRASEAVERYLRLRPDDARAHFTFGELLRHKAGGSGTDLDRMAVAYKRATELSPAMPEAHRELGLAYRAIGRAAESRASLRRYLELSPTAADRSIIESYL